MLVDGGAGQLLVERDESQEVFLDAAFSVFGTCVGAQNEGPVAGLGEEQFAGRLIQRAFLERGWIVQVARHFGHALLGHVEVRVNPGIGFVEPDFPVAFFAPGGGTGASDLVGIVFLKILGRGREFDDVLIEGGLADMFTEMEEDIGSLRRPTETFGDMMGLEHNPLFAQRSRAQHDHEPRRVEVE